MVFHDVFSLHIQYAIRVQVLVKGKDIPENAIVTGEERRQPLYIARTLYEVISISKGGICTA
jgi:hypothetical protein